MNDEVDIQKVNSSAKDYMANERTFLAWVRTSIGIMAFGFVVEKFALFLKQITFLLADSDTLRSSHAHALQSHSSVFGILIVGIGTIICFLAYLKYRQVEKQIAKDSYCPSPLLNIFLTSTVLLIGAFLVLYLNNSI